MKAAPLPTSSIFWGSRNPKSWIVFATNPVHPVWWLAPSPGAVVGVEVLVEEDVVAPVGVGLEFLRSTVDGTPTLFITQEDAGKPVRNLLGSPRRGSSACLNRWGTQF